MVDIMTIEQIELEAFRQIRRKVRDFTDESSNDEIAGYVKGVVDLETELYSILLKEKQSQKSHSIGIMEVFNIGLRGQKVTTDNRLGEIRKNTFGTEMKIIAYRKNDDIDIEMYDDDYKKFCAIAKKEGFSNSSYKLLYLYVQNELQRIKSIIS